MKRWRASALLLGGAAALALALPALSQEGPESLLPPGFGDPKAPLPEPEPADPAAPGEPGTPAPRTAPPPAAVAIPALEDLSPEELAALEALLPPKPIEMPEASRRPVETVGVIGPAEWGLDAAAFGAANGHFLSTLMRRLDAPLPSRWASILLRRALLSRVPAPPRVDPVDWVAERAWLLVRMGEADGARLLVQSVDVDRFTPKMFAVAVQASLATADPAGLCPLIEPGRVTSDEPVWALGDAICAALDGDAARASALLDQARRRGAVGGVDLSLAEKLIGAGANARRAATVQWEPVDSLNSWRFGMAAATGAEIPARLFDGAGSHVRAWHARAPMVPVEQRFDAAETAATLGVFSNASLVEMYSLVADGTDPSELAASVGGKLRRAYVNRDAAARVEAIRALWDESKTTQGRYGRLILTAAAAARIAPNQAFEEVADDLIASMLSAGFDRQAARWAGVVDGMDGASADRAWAMLALGSARPRVEISRARIGAYRGNDDSFGEHRTGMLVAALAGLGRIGDGDRDRLAGDLGLRIGARNSWTQMLDRAAETGQPGTVALLAAVGLQTGDWSGVPPEHLYHILAALRRVGLDYQARMIAAEALARL